MKSKNIWRVLFPVIFLAGLLLITRPELALGQKDELKPDVEPKLQAQILRDNSVGYIIYLHEKADLTPAYDLNWEKRGEYVVKALQETAKSSQADIVKFLNEQKVDYQTFWIDNIIIVNSSNQNTFNGLMNFSEIESLKARRIMGVINPTVEDVPESVLAVEPNISHVLAPNVWQLGISGSGIVVANIDTGVRSTHEALVRQYRGTTLGSHDYNWLGAAGGSGIPVDDNGHGTHTMGTMVGEDASQTNQIGMAPSAQWIACDGCEGTSCPDAALLTCAQWITAPYPIGDPGSPNTSMRPHIVNNSWGDCGTSYDNWFQASVDAWLAAGIYPIFSNGNASNCGYSSPPGLNTVGNPARYGNVTGVGSTGESNGEYANHSNWGPTDNLDFVNPKTGWEDIKPQVLAPGVNIRSSTPGSDSQYQDGWSGTSMSAPHVSGLVALMWQAGPCLIGDYATTENILEVTATPILYDDGTGAGAHSPNYATGWGEINALSAVQEALNICQGGTLNGSVKDAITSDPIENAQIFASLSVTQTFSTSTDSFGDYELTLPTGAYTVTTERFGYQPNTVNAVSVISGTETTLDIELTPSISHQVSGTVTDAATGWPLYASIEIDGYPGEPIWSDPETGYYEILLPEGINYSFYVNAWVPGYLPANVDVGPLTGNITHDFTLDVDVSVCSAPGYTQVTTSLLSETFNSGIPGSWIVIDNSGGTGCPWVDTDPGSRGNLTGGSGAFAIADSDMCGSGTESDTDLDSPAIDASSYSALRISYANDFNDLGSIAQVQVWDNSSWITVDDISGTDYRGPETRIIHTTVGAGYGNTSVRFHYEAGWDWWWEVDDVVVDGTNCVPSPGGLVVGNVYDDNTLESLNGAIVENDDGFQAEAQATPLDENVDDGFFSIFSPSGSKTFTATISSGYGPDVNLVNVTSGNTIRHDFYLPAPSISVDPTKLEVVIPEGYRNTVALEISNLGALASDFELTEVPGSPVVVAKKPDIPSASPERLKQVGVEKFIDTPFAPAADVIQDGGFEVGTPNAYWNEASTNFGTPICDVGSCGTGTGTGPRTGAFWTWFGGIAAFEEGQVDQDVIIPVGTASLNFWLEQIVCDSASDYLEVLIDGTQVYFSDGGSPLCGVLGYSEQRMDISSYADGDAHNVAFHSEVFASSGGVSNFFIDDVQLDADPLTDIPWLSIDPITGTLSADSMQVIDVTFDTLTYTIGTYTGVLKVKADDLVYNQIDIPVTMHVEAASYGSALSAVNNHLSGEPGSVVTYTVWVENTGNVPDSFDITAGSHNWDIDMPTVVGPLDPTESHLVEIAITIPLDANDGDSDSVTISASSQGDPAETAAITLTSEASIKKYLINLPLVSR